MSPVLERIATITEKGQTTVPKPVREALGVRSGDRIVFRIEGGGVSIHRAENDDQDPALEGFLALLAEDIASRPGALAAMTPVLAKRIAQVVEGVEVDVQEAIEGEVDL